MAKADGPSIERGVAAEGRRLRAVGPGSERAGARGCSLTKGRTLRLRQLRQRPSSAIRGCGRSTILHLRLLLVFFFFFFLFFLFVFFFFIFFIIFFFL